MKATCWALALCLLAACGGESDDDEGGASAAGRNPAENAGEGGAGASGRSAGAAGKVVPSAGTNSPGNPTAPSNGAGAGAANGGGGKAGQVAAAGQGGAGKAGGGAAGKAGGGAAGTAGAVAAGAGGSSPGKCDLTCEKGQHCELIAVTCIRAPCPAQPMCVSDGSGSGSITCDPRKILCKRAVPECPELQVPSVDGSCYGPCVPMEMCPCKGPEECPAPEKGTCHMSAGHCGPFVR